VGAGVVEDGLVCEALGRAGEVADGPALWDAEPDQQPLTAKTPSATNTIVTDRITSVALMTGWTPPGRRRLPCSTILDDLVAAQQPPLHCPPLHCHGRDGNSRP
jgi:hypothetical protein